MTFIPYFKIDKIGNICEIYTYCIIYLFYRSVTEMKFYMKYFMNKIVSRRTLSKIFFFSNNTLNRLKLFDLCIKVPQLQI